MDSINQQQPEDNIKNLDGDEAWQKVKELAEKADTCFMCTNIKYKNGAPLLYPANGHIKGR